MISQVSYNQVPFSDGEISVLVDVLRDWEVHPGMPDPQIYADIADALLARELTDEQWYGLDSVLDVELGERPELEWFLYMVRRVRRSTFGVSTA
jgi:hypothetical protein